MFVSLLLGLKKQIIQFVSIIDVLTLIYHGDGSARALGGM